ncbi:MAG: two-component regulator propeller domain-containing protein [Polyangiales bacterium]
MLIRTVGLLGLVAISTATTCLGSGNTNTPRPSGELAPVRNFTDSDVIMGVATTTTDVFVATQRGVLKYPAAGGSPARFTDRDGLPSNQVWAISADPEGTVWAGSARGVVRFDGTRWAVAGDPNAQPDVGRVTSVLALAGGVLVGGAQGIARWDGTGWILLTNRYQVISFYLDQGRPMVATAQHGVLAFRGDYSEIDEYGSTTGVPETMVRSIVGVGAGKFFALAQGGNGSKLLYHDGTHWISYTSSTARSPWIGLVPGRNNAVTLITREGAFDVRAGEGDELAVIGSDISQPAQPRRVTLSQRRIEPPPPPPPPVQPPPQNTGRGRGRGRAGAATTPPRHKETPEISARRLAPVEHSVSEFAVRAPTVSEDSLAQRAPRDAGASSDASAAPMDSGARPTAVVDSGVRAQDSGARASVDAGAISLGLVAPIAINAGADGGAAAPRAEEPPPRPRNIPDFAGPADVPPPGATTDAPRFGLVRTSWALPDDVLAAFVTRDSVFVSRVGLGVSRVTGGEATDFRSHDLALSRRPLSLATDSQNNVWFVTEDGGAVKFDGRRFSRATLDAEGQAVPLAFWSRGNTCVAVGRVGPNTVRTFRWDRDHWRQVTERPIDTRGPGTVDAKFLVVDERGRYWMGVRVIERPNSQSALDLGVAMIDENVPSAIQFHHEVPPQGAEFGAVPVPNDLTAADFDSDGNIWFAGLTGATRITPPAAGQTAYRAQTFNEATGLRGDLVSDLSRAVQGRVYVATSEGIGYWGGERFQFDIAGSSAQVRVTALTTDNNGALWGAGQRGAWAWDGQTFRTFGRANGLPTEQFTDIGVDGENRVWFVTSEGITIFAQSAHSVGGSSAQASSGGSAN